MPKRVFLNPPKPVCAPKGCPVILGTQCIHYSGDATPCLQILPNTPLNEVIKRIDEALCETAGNFQLYTEDTVTLNLSGAGTISDPLKGDVNISEIDNNGILVFPDGLFVLAPRSGLVYGGVVTWISGYTYHISAAGYFINGNYYESPETTITLNPPDDTYNRIDTFIVDTSSVASVLEGDPSDNPAQAGIDLGTQLELSFALVEVGTTQPSLDTECAYLENIEWTTSTNSSTINLASSSDSFSGSVSIEGTNVNAGANIRLIRSTTFNPTDYSVITFKIKSKGSWGVGSAAKRLNITLRSGGGIAGLSLNLQNYGLDPSVTTWQTITVPIYAFSLGTSAIPLEGIGFDVSGGSFPTMGFFIDNVCLQDVPVVLPGIPLKLQNGLTYNPTTNTGELGGSLLHHTTNYTGYFVHTLSGATVYNYPYQFKQEQNFANSTGIANYKSKGAIQVSSPDYNNSVTLGINYTSDVYQSSPLIEGYFGDRIGYMMNTNLTGNGSFGMRMDDNTSKSSGVFFHTKDTGTDGLTLFARPAVGSGTYTSGLSNFKGITLHTDKDLTFYGYPNTRNDGIATRFLTTDSSGNVELRDIDFSGLPIEDNYVDGASFNSATGDLTLTRTGALADIVTNLDGRYLTNVDVNNGLTEDVTNHFQLGGPLIKNTALTGIFNLSVNDGSVSVGAASAAFSKLYVQGTASQANAFYALKDNSPTSAGDVAATGRRLIQTTAFSASAVQAGLYGELGFNNNSGFTFSGGAHVNLSGLVGVFTMFMNSGNLTSGSSLFSAGAYYANLAGTGVVDKIASVRTQYPIQTPGQASFTGSVTNYYGIYLDDLSSSLIAARLTNKWGIYQAGANDKNYFGGQITANTVPLYTSGGYSVVVWNTATKRLENVAAGDIGGGSAYTVNNGLTENPSGNFQLGGTLLQNTTIATTADYVLSITGSTGYSAGEEALLRVVTTSASGQAIYATSTSSSEAAIQAIGGTYGVKGSAFFGIYGDGSVTGVTGISSTGTGVSASSISGTGLIAQSTSGTGLSVIVTPVSASTIVQGMSITRNTSGIATSGIGVSIDGLIENDGGASNISNQIIFKLTDVISGSEVSQTEIWNKNGGSLNRVLSVSGTGRLTLDTYGDGIHTGTVTKWLAVTVDGDVVEVDPPTLGGGGGSVTSVDLAMPSAFSVSGGPITTSGVLTVTATGTTSDYIRGDGSLAAFPTTLDLNFAEDDLVFSGNRTHTLSGNTLLIDGTNVNFELDGVNEAILNKVVSGTQNMSLNVGGSNKIVLHAENDNGTTAYSMDTSYDSNIALWQHYSRAIFDSITYEHRLTIATGAITISSLGHEYTSFQITGVPSGKQNSIVYYNEADGMFHHDYYPTLDEIADSGNVANKSLKISTSGAYSDAGEVFAGIAFDNTAPSGELYYILSNNTGDFDFRDVTNLRLSLKSDGTTYLADVDDATGVDKMVIVNNGIVSILPVPTSGTADGNNFTEDLTFDNLTGDLTLQRFGLPDIVTNIDGRYVEQSALSEEVQDIIGFSTVVDTSSVDAIYDDVGNTLELHVLPNFIYNLTQADEVRFKVGDTGAPVVATDTTFILQDCDGVALTDKKVKFYRGGLLQYQGDDYTYDPVTAAITVTVAFSADEKLIFEAWPDLMWRDCLIGTGGGSEGALSINGEDELLVNSTDTLLF
jgi:hypothetical protein